MRKKIRFMDRNNTVEKWIRRTASGCAAIAAVLAALAGLSWILDRWQILTFGAQYIPMAPSTALLIILLALVVIFRNHRPGSVIVNLLGFTFVCLVMSFALSVITQDFFRLSGLMEQWLSPSAETVLGIPVGRMAPLTAWTFLCAGLAVSGQLKPFRLWKPGKYISSVLSLLTILIGLMILLAYGSGVPLIFGESVVPMAILTAVAFVFLGAGLFLPTGMMADFLFPATAGEAGSGIPKTLILLFVFVMAGIGAAGYLFLKRQMDDARKTTQETLTAIADLKIDQIGAWRNGHLTFAGTIMESQVLADHFGKWMADSSDLQAKNLVTNTIEALHKHLQYSHILLWDRDGRPFFAVPAGPVYPLISDSPYIAEATQARQALFSDLHLDGAPPGFACLDLYVPLISFYGNDRNREKIRGVFQLVINPNDFLFPLIQSWPTPSRTAETLLVRRDGNDLLYLNELRHKKHSALRLRKSIDQSDLPAAMAVRGETGVREGRDYRGVPVLAAIHPVPGTSWFILAKMDQAEIYSPLRQQAAITGILIGILYLAAFLGAILVWRKWNLRNIQRASRDRQMQQTLADRIRYLSDYVHDIILLADDSYRILEANEKALETYGYTLPEIQRKSLRDLQPPEQQPDFEQQITRLDPARSTQYETMQQRRDGTTFPVENSVLRIDQAGVSYYQCILRDITARKLAESGTHRLLDETQRARAALLSILEDQREAEETLRSTMNRLIDTEEDLRKEASQQLHDQVGQNLTALSINLSFIRSRISGEAGRMVEGKLADSFNLLDDTITRIRNVMSDLRPSVLDDYGLFAALTWSAGKFSERTQIPVKVTGKDLELRPEREIEYALFRMVQEALHNIMKHARAGQVTLELHEQPETVRIVITDNGVGFDPEEIRSRLAGKGFGLSAMIERMKALGGTCEILSAPGEGTTVVLEIRRT
jgi:PAS domain S-box-containing protein